MSTKKMKKSPKNKNMDAQKLVIQLYKDYASKISKNLWPWEKLRWYELVFCFFTTIGEPQVLAGTIRRLTDTMAKLGLLELDILAKLNPTDKEAVIITIDTLLQKAGFTSSKSKIAVTTICEAAHSIKEKYDGKVQNYLRKYGNHILDQIEDDFGFTQFSEASRAMAIWLQNTLNMPVPATNPIADMACEKLGVSYDILVEAAIQQDINVALLDDALRAYWEKEYAKK